MKKTDFLEAMNKVDQKYVAESINYKKSTAFAVYARYAACIALVLVSVFMAGRFVKPYTGDGTGIHSGETVKHGGDITVPSVTEPVESGNNTPNYSGNTSENDGIKKEMLGLSGELLGMTVGEIEAVYGTLTEEYSEQGPRRPVYSVEKIKGLYLVFHNWQYTVPLEKDMKPTEILLNTDSRSMVCGVAVGDDIANSVDFLRENNASINWGYTGVYIKVEAGGYRVTYRMDLMDLVIDGKPQDEQEYLKSPRGKILQIRVEAIS